MSLSFVVALAIAAVASATPGPGTFDLYYKRSWDDVYLHYNPDGAGWNPIPGVKMSPSSNASFPADSWSFVEVGGNSVVFVLTDGNGNWDNNGGQNYVAADPGVYSLDAGALKAIQIFQKACPGTPECSGHGTCDQTTLTCKCDSGYTTSSCAKVCPGGVSAPCSNHGVCEEDATCTCSKGFASCSAAKDCSTSVMTDVHNCGGCNVTCLPNPSAGVRTATCANAQCTRTCESGFSLCQDGTCSKGGCALPGCETYHENQCNGNVIVTPSNFTNHRWQTPAKGSPHYRASYQDMSVLQGHVRVVYDASLTSATATVVPVTKDASLKLTFSFNGVSQSSPSKKFSASESSAKKPVKVSISGSDGSKLDLEDIDFAWAAGVVATRTGDFREGQKGAIVEMFGWPHADVEKECAFLAKAGYLGAKLFPVHEQVLAQQPFQDVMNPWFFMYQPVSYRLQGRMGSRDALRSAIHTCRSLGVRVYADAVINHMTGNGNDNQPEHRDNNCVYFPAKNTSAFAAPSPYFTQGFQYEVNPNTGLPASQEFPSVPYGPTDFHCERVLNSWTDPLDLNAGWLTGLVDLNTEKENVQQRIADYMTDLIGIGFSGFRVDAAKHIKPDDLVGIFSKLKTNLGGSLPADFIVWMEVLLGGEADMLLCNTDSGYNYAEYLSTALATAGFTQTDIDKLKIWFSAYPNAPGEDCGKLSMLRKVIQNDDADQQTSGSSSRDMHDQGSVLVKDRDVPRHRGFEVKLFTNPNGVTDNDNDYPIRVVLSSYYFDIGQQPYGIPDGLSDCARAPAGQTCRGSMPQTPAYVADAQGYAGPVYTRVHRDQAIVNAMNQWMHI